VTKAHIEIATLRAEVKTQEEKSGKKSIHTAFARYNLGSALLWEVLLHPSVRECCAVDYFRLSRTDVEERESDGVLVCTET